jgi:Protein of unknown function (DUF3768)
MVSLACRPRWWPRLLQVAAFTDFNKENDPHEEHDYLRFDLCNREFVFIIHFDLKLEGHSLDPANPAITKRVGTLMLTYEW